MGAGERRLRVLAWCPALSPTATCMLCSAAAPTHKAQGSSLPRVAASTASTHLALNQLRLLLDAHADGLAERLQGGRAGGGSAGEGGQQGSAGRCPAGRRPRDASRINILLRSSTPKPSLSSTHPPASAPRCGSSPWKRFQRRQSWQRASRGPGSWRCPSRSPSCPCPAAHKWMVDERVSGLGCKSARVDEIFGQQWAAGSRRLARSRLRETQAALGTGTGMQQQQQLRPRPECQQPPLRPTVRARGHAAAHLPRQQHAPPRNLALLDHCSDHARGLQVNCSWQVGG